MINRIDLKNLDNSKYDFVSYCPQFSQNAFNPKLTVLEHIHLTIRGNNLKYDIKEIDDLMYRLGLDLPLLNHYPYMLSGGQKQRLILLLSVIKKT